MSFSAQQRVKRMLTNLLSFLRIESQLFPTLAQSAVTRLNQELPEHEALVFQLLEQRSILMRIAMQNPLAHCVQARAAKHKRPRDVRQAQSVLEGGWQSWVFGSPVGQALRQLAWGLEGPETRLLMFDSKCLQHAALQKLSCLV